MSLLYIHNALRIQLASGESAWTIAYENTPGTPKSTGWMRENFMPSDKSAAALGTTAQNYYTGVYQIDIFAPKKVGTSESETKAEAIMAKFARGTTLTDNSVSVKIRKAYRKQAIEEEDFFHIPIVVYWQAYA